MSDELSDQLKALKKAADNIHDEVEELVNQVDNLETEIDNTRNEVAELAFDSLGLSYDDLDGYSISEIVEKLVDALKDLKDKESLREEDSDEE